ncbi:hypothetical protein LCGC14_2983380 [marine sediment metagenome]|uniref:Uncharacterized protein n=1 Tax=marine sediment metagenome TaxID=412755 RepID=A0A0F8ZDF5_9ZZZZ
MPKTLPILNPHLVFKEDDMPTNKRKPGRPKGSRNISGGTRANTVTGLLSKAHKHEQIAKLAHEQARKLHESQGQQLKQSGA